jgi:20S proteasome subunit beta 3
MYTIKEEREITPITFAHLVSSTLYERRFGPYFIEPVVAGLEPIPTPDGATAEAPRRFKPFIASTDLIGCINWAKVSTFPGKPNEYRPKQPDSGFRCLRDGFREALRYGGSIMGARLVSIATAALFLGSRPSSREAEDLFETISQTLLNAVDRDAYSGWGAVVTVLFVVLSRKMSFRLYLFLGHQTRLLLGN